MSSTPLARRLTKLADDIDKLNGNVEWQLGKIGNALIEEAKQQMPNDSVLAQVDLFTESQQGNINGLLPQAVSAVLRQVAEALPPTPAAMPVADSGGPITQGIADMQW